MDFLRKLISSVSNSIMCQSTTNAEQIEKLSYEVVITWQQSFDNLMSNKKGQKIFVDFLKENHCDANFFFWQACEEFKREEDAERIEVKAILIYMHFISAMAYMHVSLDPNIIDSIKASMENLSATTFNEAQDHIYTRMKNENYPRFLASSVYRKLVGGGTVEKL